MYVENVGQKIGIVTHKLLVICDKITFYKMCNATHKLLGMKNEVMTLSLVKSGLWLTSCSSGEKM